MNEQPILNYKNEIAFTVEESGIYFDALATSFMKLFRTGETFYVRLDNAGYRHIKREITREDWLSHLFNMPDSELVLIPVNEQGVCYWGAIDLDRHLATEDAVNWTKLAQLVTEKHLSIVVVASGGAKGAHLFVFFRDPEGVPAANVTKILKYYATLLGMPNAEVFPKQKSLTSKTPYGNGISLPYHWRKNESPEFLAANPTPEGMTGVFSNRPIAYDAAGEPIIFWEPFLDFSWERAVYSDVILDRLPVAESLTPGEIVIKAKPIKRAEAVKLYERSLETLRNTPIGGNGNDQIYKTAALAGNLLEGLGKTRAQVTTEILHVVTADWKSPHPEAEARSTIDGGIDKGLLEPYAVVLPPKLPWQNSRNPVKIEKHPALIERMIYAKSLTALIGKVKLGKTTLCLDACECFIFGRDFLGEKVHAGSVLYVSEQAQASFIAELHNSGLVESGQLVLGSPPQLGQFEYITAEHHYGYSWSEIVEATLEHAIATGATLVCFDTLSRIARIENENDASEVQRVVDELTPFLKHGIAVLFVSHERKSGGDISDAGRGSSAIVGSVDVILRLTKPEGNHPSTYRQLDFIGRFPGPGSPKTLERTTADINSRYKAIADVAAIAAKSAQQSILDMFDGDTEAAYTFDEILAESLGKRSTVQRSLRDMVQRHRLKKTGLGKRGEPAKYMLQETAF